VDKYPFESSVPVPAEAGDVVLFSIYTIHGSSLNRRNGVSSRRTVT